MTPELTGDSPDVQKRPPAAQGERGAAVTPIELGYARGAADALPGVAAPLTNLRMWFVVYLLWMIGLTVISQHFFHRYEVGDTAARGPWLLAGMCFYLTLCNLFMPLPTSWIVLLAASNDAAIVGDPYQRVLIVAVAGAAATMMANLSEYHILGYFFQARLGERIRRSRAYLWSVRWFDVSPFRVLVLVAFVPIPIDVVRWIAILRRYPRPAFASAYFIGRTLRYALLGFVSVALSLTTWQIVLIQVGLVLLLAARLLSVMLLKALAGARTSAP